jgi:hypothetical protein
MRPALGLLLLLACCQAPRPPLAAAVEQPFCTRTLGMPECFATPGLLPDHPAPLGDTPVRPAVPPVPWWKRVTDNWTNQ